MSFLNRIMASGLAPLAAQNITGDVSSALSAAGTTKATATVLSSAVNYASVVSSGKGFSLPAMNQGDGVEFYNGGANAALIYTTAGVADTITNKSANGGFTVSTMKGAFFKKVTSTLVMVNLSA